MDFSIYFNLPLWLRLAIQGIAVIAVLFPIAAACSMAERKISAWIQGRPGPNRTVPPFLAGIPIIVPILQHLGLFQLAADGGKFVFKEDPIPGQYLLEVSSPGLDRPLTRSKDFARFAGYEAKLETVMPVDGRKRFTGKIVGLTPDGAIAFAPEEGAAIVVPFSNFARAKLVLTDELIKAAEAEQG